MRVWGCSLCLAGTDPFTITLSVPFLGHKNRTRGAAQGPSKPRNRQMSQPCSPRAGPSRKIRREEFSRNCGGLPNERTVMLSDLALS